MQKFYEGCVACAFRGKDFCSERCFECAQPDITKEDCLHSIGAYFSRCREEHRTSTWSQAIIKVKRRFIPVVLSFGRVVAYYMDRELSYIKPYLITNVPSYYSEPQHPNNVKNCTMQLLAYSVFSNLKNRKWVDVKQVLIQSRMKEKQQHSCRTDAQRKRNIQGVYAVQDAEIVEGRNIILLDDVVTSGATMGECAKKLSEAGARTVIGVALARTVRINSTSISGCRI